MSNEELGNVRHDIWSKQFADSGVLELLEELIGTPLTGDESELGPGSIDHLRCQMSIVITIRTTLLALDPGFIPKQSLTTIKNHLTQAKQSLTNWDTSRQDTQLTNTTNKLQALLPTIGTLPNAGSPDAAIEVESLRRSFGQYRSQAVKHIKEADAAIEAAQQAFLAKSEGADSKIVELEAEVEQLRTDLSEAMSEIEKRSNNQQTSFTTAQDKRSNTHSELLEKHRSGIQSALDDADAKATAKVDQFQKLVKKHETEAATKLQQLDETLGIAGEKSIIKHYSDVADHEQTLAWRWQAASILLLLTAVGIGVWAVSSTSAKFDDWDRLAAKAFIVIPLGTAGTFAVTQAREHRHAHRGAEHATNQLASLEPFLKNIDNEDTKRELRTQFANQFFGQTPNTPTKQNLRKVTQKPVANTKQSTD